MSESSLVEFQSAVKRFGGTLAVDQVSLNIEAGSILALLGENGAGKSTLIKLLAGIHQLDAGQILMKGDPIATAQSASVAALLPIAFIHQDLGLVEWMTVAENMAMSIGYQRRLGLIRWRAIEKKATAALEMIGGGINPATRVFNLSRTEKSLVAIARALAVDAELLVLDEPTASLPEADVERLFEVLRMLRVRGVGMIYISHRLDEVFRLSNRVAVMRDGKLIGVRDVAETDEKELVNMIVGRPPSEIYTRAPAVDAGVVLSLTDVVTGDVGPVSFEVKAGEMVGLAGLRGAGQATLGRTLFGLHDITSGQILLEGKQLTVSSPQEAIASGVNFVSGNRQEESVAMNMTMRENMFMNPATLGQNPFQALRPAEERVSAQALADKFHVHPADPEYEIFALSGGNQQKVVMARWLNIGGKLLILEEPTQGVDVGAKAEIYALLNEALAQGTAVVVVSTDFEEIANICHRTYVFSRGRIVAQLSGDELSMSSLILNASGSQELSQ